MSPHRAGTPGSRLSVWKYVEEHAFHPLNSTTFIKPLCLNLLLLHPPSVFFQHLLPFGEAPDVKRECKNNTAAKNCNP